MGTIQDCSVLETVLHKIVTKKDLKPLPTLNAMLRENRQQQWQKWRTKQKLYLDNTYKEGLRLAIEKPL